MTAAGDWYTAAQRVRQAELTMRSFVIRERARAACQESVLLRLRAACLRDATRRRLCLVASRAGGPRYLSRPREEGQA